MTDMRPERPEGINGMDDYRNTEPLSPEELRQRRQRREALRKKRKRQRILRILVTVTLALLVLAGAGVLLYFTVIRKPGKKETLPVIVTTKEGETEETSSGDADPSGESASEQTEGSETEAPSGEYAALLAAAKRMALMYDFDGAVQYIGEQVPDYENHAELQNFVSECMAEKALLVRWADNTQITHVFFHSLIADKEVAFGSSKCDEYNEYMTTIPEFNRILETLYAKGYVLVHLSDIAEITAKEDGSQQMTMKGIYLPEGKTPFVLSVDDLSYYDYMDETGGFADRLVIDENGRVVCEIDQADGTKVRGDYDVVPILDAFVEEHPDFSYHGAKGTVALTGYNGILGYRTSDVTYGPGNETYPQAHTYDNPNIEADKAAAKAVAEAMKAAGWKFASHTWGHANMSKLVDQSTGAILDQTVFERQMQWWDDEVRPLIGDTDIIIFAFGADIGSWRGYTDDNAAFTYLKNKGFNYFCNVDSSQHTWVQVSGTVGGTGYFRQGRRNLDGQLMLKSLIYPEKEILSDLFDVKEIFDRDRPVPIPGVVIPEGYDFSKLFD